WNFLLRQAQQALRQVVGQDAGRVGDAVPVEAGDEVGGRADAGLVEQAQGVAEVAGELLGADAVRAERAEREAVVALRELLARRVEDEREVGVRGRRAAEGFDEL